MRWSRSNIRRTALRRAVSAGIAILIMTTAMGLSPGAAVAAPRCSWKTYDNDGDQGGVSGHVKVLNSSGETVVKATFKAYGEVLTTSHRLRRNETAVLATGGDYYVLSQGHAYLNLKIPEGQAAVLLLAKGNTSCSVSGLIT